MGDIARHDTMRDQRTRLRARQGWHGKRYAKGGTTKQVLATIKENPGHLGFSADELIQRVVRPPRNKPVRLMRQFRENMRKGGSLAVANADPLREQIYAKSPRRHIAGGFISQLKQA
jgi:hypothetical protein